MESETQDEVEEVVTESTENESEQTQELQEPERRQETPEAKRARLTRELERLNKKYPTEQPENKVTNSSDVDYAELAYLAAKGIEAPEEIAFVKKVAKTANLPLHEAMRDEFVQAKLKSMREATAVEEAVPSNSKRSNAQAKDNVDYWIAKNELPDDVELRRKVVNARIQRETQRDVFGA